jgi:hypothetical protein
MGFFVAPFFASPFFNTGTVQPVGPPKVLFRLEAAPVLVALPSPQSVFMLPPSQTIFTLEAPQ